MKLPTFVYKDTSKIYFDILVLLLMIALCFLGPFFYPQDYHTQNLLLGAQKPSLQHWLGTDALGRDLLARLLYGGRISIFIGCFVSLFAVTLGLIIGSISGFIGGNTDRLLMRIIDVLYPLPFTLLIILVMSLGGRHVWLLILTMGSVKWMTMARMIRTQVTGLKTSAFVQCSQSLGQSSFQIWWKHIFPNLGSILLVYGTLLMPNIILEEAFISFLGLGIQPPLCSLGSLIFSGANEMETAPWLLLSPALFFSVLLCFFNKLGDHLRDFFAL